MNKKKEAKKKNLMSDSYRLKPMDRHHVLHMSRFFASETLSRKRECRHPARDTQLFAKSTAIFCKNQMTVVFCLFFFTIVVEYTGGSPTKN